MPATISNTTRRFEQELSAIHSLQESRAITRLVLDHVGVSKLDQLTDPDRKLTQAQEESLDRMLSDLRIGKPVQYVIGSVHFLGLQIFVDQGVLIPRPETEELVQMVVDSGLTPQRILDIGTGSGVIACSLKSQFPKAKVFGVDIDEDALKLAKRNAAVNTVEVEFSILDILDIDQAHPQVDLVISNPPYVPIVDKPDMERTVIDFEPDLALFSNEPLQFYVAIAKRFYDSTVKDIFLECHCMYAYQVRELFLAMGFSKAVLSNDSSGLPRFVYACK